MTNDERIALRAGNLAHALNTTLEFVSTHPWGTRYNVMGGDHVLFQVTITPGEHSAPVGSVTTPDMNMLSALCEE